MVSISNKFSLNKYRLTNWLHIAAPSSRSTINCGLISPWHFIVILKGQNNSLDFYHYQCFFQIGYKLYPIQHSLHLHRSVHHFAALRVMYSTYAMLLFRFFYSAQKAKNYQNLNNHVEDMHTYWWVGIRNRKLGIHCRPCLVLCRLKSPLLDYWTANLLFFLIFNIKSHDATAFRF